MTRKLWDRHRRQMIGGVAQPDGVAHLVTFGLEVAPPFAPGSQVLETRVFVLC